MKAFRQIILFLIPVLGFAYTAKADFSEESKIKINLLSGKKDKTEEVNRLIDKGYQYLWKSKTDFRPVKECIDSVHLICLRAEIETPSRYHLLYAEYYFATGDFRKASEEASAAMKKAESADDDKDLSKAMIFFGRYYLRTSFLQESLQYFKNAISIADKKNLQGIKPAAIVGLVNVYRALDDKPNYRMSLINLIEASTAEKDTMRAITGYYFLGTIYAGDNATVTWRNFSTADSLLKICYNLAVLRKDTVNAANALANMGWNFYLAKMYDPALASYKKSLAYSIPAGIHAAAANSYGNIGNIYRDLGNTEVSLSFYKKSLEQAMMVKDWYSLEWVYKDISDLYLNVKDTVKAFKAYILHKQFNDSLLTYQRISGLMDARLRYETDTQIREVELLSLKLKNQRLMLWGFCGLIILLLAIGWLIFRTSKHKEKTRLSEMNRKIAEIRQANLRQQMNPHFIFNTLNSIQYYMYQHDKLATNNYLTKFSNLMRKVLDNSQHTSIPLRDELNALNLYLELECIRFKDKFTYEIKVDDEIDTMLYKIPTMLIQPYVENSICHGLMPLEGKGSVKIDIKLDTDHLMCTIEDNGIGREAAQERKTGTDCNHNSLGTQIVNSRLDLVNELYGTSLKTKYTDLKDVNGEPAGTLVEIHIPILT